MLFAPTEGRGEGEGVGGGLVGRGTELQNGPAIIKVLSNEFDKASRVRPWGAHLPLNRRKVELNKDRGEEKVSEEAHRHRERLELPRVIPVYLDMSGSKGGLRASVVNKVP